ncbi:MAG TPA: hypothetical protein VKT73_03720 [Xanthobacteraceae bacterium]|nr:hypothetical protein [Xanthobacteraceae bacterium]
MSLAESAHTLIPAAKTEERFPLVPTAFVAWVTIAIATLVTGSRVFDAMSTDDLMRLAEVRDFLGGQGWFDLMQYRLDPPSGASMHWSRIVDLPLAGMIAALSPVLGRAGAETVTSSVWPIVLLFPTLVLAGALARRLSNSAAMLPAILLVAMSAPVLVHFRPGALDHHGYQLMLLLATIYALTERGDARLVPALGGLASAISIAIGLEMAPMIAALLAACGLRWVIEGERAAKLTTSFGLAFGAGTVALFAVTVPPAEWNVTTCDFISPPCIAAAGFSGGLLALLAQSSARLKSVFSRLAAGAVAGGLVIGLMLASFSDCLRDPYAAVAARVAEVWIAHIAETQTIFELGARSPGETIAIYGPVAVAIVLGVIAVLRVRNEARLIWIAPLLTLFALGVTACWEVRGASGGSLVAQPVLAAALVLLIGARGSLPAPKTVLALLAVSGPLLVGIGTAVDATLLRIDPTRTVAYQDGPLACRKIADVASLAKLSPGRVISYVDLGPAILIGSRHSVFAAPYHRNLGNEVAVDVLLGDDTTAKRLLAEHQVDYVAVCPGSPERINFQRVAPEGLSERLSRGEVPPYLESIPGTEREPLRVFRVRE